MAPNKKIHGPSTGEGSWKVERTCRRFFKGQTFLIDTFAFLSASMFVVILFIFMLSTTNNFRSQDERMQKAIENAADALMAQGDPIAWERNVSGVHILGLADRRGRMDASKLAALNQTDFTDLLSLNPYNVSIKLLKGGVQVYSIGGFNSSARVGVAERLVLYNNSPHTLRITASEEFK